MGQNEVDFLAIFLCIVGLWAGACHDGPSELTVDSEAEGESEIASLTCPSGDEGEDNDSVASADTLELSEPINGVVCASETCVADESGETDECDVFRVNVPAASVLDITLRFSQVDGDLDLWVFNEFGTIYGASYSETDNEFLDDTFVLSAGDVYVAVCGWNCASNAYELTVQSDGNYVPSDDDGDGDCTNDIQWNVNSNAWRTGETVSNWSFHGYMDGNSDGTVEQVESTFTLEDIHCDGHRGLVVMWGDTS